MQVDHRAFMDPTDSGANGVLSGHGGQQTLEESSGGAAIGGNSSMDSLTDSTSDVLCRGCNHVLYSKVANATTAQNGKSWRCNVCLQFFTVKSSAKRHVTHSHNKDYLCDECQRTTNGLPPPAKCPAGNMVYTQQQPDISMQGETEDEDDDDEEDIEADGAELGLLDLMLKNNLDLKAIDGVLALIKSGKDFSRIHNASHWLSRLGRHAAVQYTTYNCPHCKRAEVQLRFEPGSSTSSMETLQLAGGHTLTSAGPAALASSLDAMAHARQHGITGQLIQQQPGQTIVGHLHGGGSPGMGTVVGFFDTSTGQLITADNANIDKSVLQKVKSELVVAQQNQGQQAVLRLPYGMTAGVPTSNATQMQISPTGSSFAVQSASNSAAPPRNPAKRRNNGTPKTPSSTTASGGAEGSTSWKAIARNLLQSLHSKEELLRLCVVGRRMDRTSGGLQPMDAEKRKIIGEAVREHCEKAQIPIPPDTLLNHFMSQILCDSRRKEQVTFSGGQFHKRTVKQPKAPQSAAQSKMVSEAIASSIDDTVAASVVVIPATPHKDNGLP
ncbi:hypothetical protein RvY_03978-2 [Ramazzottius varieornatus]|uniref:C2H2-type domain-containing protein n=1 Tax=Ramazzottius varieornatus TaxID=947166 RepID=A0A1D1UPY2_RAMVA|nr:hypothetical protein RvY_03978-2 [Ramazzottius varieornatus]